jgi:hypothetical protein
MASAIVHGAFAVGLAAVNVVQTAYYAVQTSTNALMAANSVGLVVITIAVLAAGFVLAYNKLRPFHDAVNSALVLLKARVTVGGGFAVRDAVTVRGAFAVDGMILRGAFVVDGMAMGRGARGQRRDRARRHDRGRGRRRGAGAGQHHRRRLPRPVRLRAGQRGRRRAELGARPAARLLAHARYSLAFGQPDRRGALVAVSCRGDV